MLRDGCDVTVQPEWLDYDLLSKWQSGEWTDPTKAGLPPADQRHAIDCDGVLIPPWELKGDERKIAKNFFLRTNIPVIDQLVVAEDVNNILPPTK